MGLVAIVLGLMSMFLLAVVICQRFVLLRLHSELERITFLLSQEEAASRILEELKHMQEEPK